MRVYCMHPVERSGDVWTSAEVRHGGPMDVYGASTARTSADRLDTRMKLGSRESLYNVGVVRPTGLRRRISDLMGQFTTIGATTWFGIRHARRGGD
jgi:hypothetical protein